MTAHRGGRALRATSAISRSGGSTSASDEPVAHARLGLDVSRTRGIGFELATELGDVNPQVVGLVLETGAPDLLQEVRGGDQATRLAGEDLEDLPFRRREPDGRPVRPPDDCGAEVYDEVRGD